MSNSFDDACGDEDRNLHTGTTDILSSDLVETQKHRAIARWDQAFARKDFEQSVYDDVLSYLKKGEVLPIYHTLCRDPAKRLFSPHELVIPQNPESGRIELSTNEVSAGICKSKKSATWGDKNHSYLDVFFQSDGQCFFNIPDDFLKIQYTFNTKISKAVAALINTPAKMVGHDLEVTELETEFPVDRFSGRNLITRSLSRGVVGDCFEDSVPHSSYAIVGTPGIGKSWNLIYALQQSLLYENACITVCFQKYGSFWLCIRKNHHIYVWTSEAEHFVTHCHSKVFGKGGVVLLLDPGESCVGGASFCKPSFIRVIFAASLNSRHSGNIDKITAFHARILNPYTMKELQIALKYMSNTGVKYTDEEIAPMLDRVKEVGCLPRYILSSDASETPKKQLAEFLKSDERSLLKRICGPDRFKNITAIKDLCGGAFALHASGSIVEDDDVHPTQIDIGYDGDVNVDYTTKIVTYTSEYVKQEIAKVYADMILQEKNKKK